MLRRYAMRFAKWARYARGGSYQHVAQGLGRRFTADGLEGYFNDLTLKADWKGETGALGEPLVRTDSEPRFAFAIVIFQWGLGGWDRWLLSDRTDAARRDTLMAAARWGVENLDARGGWPCWTGLKRPVTSPYSAMAQGEGLSVLARAASLDPGGPWRAAADRAYAFLMDSGDAGLTLERDGVVSLEEYPGEAMRGVLNGWMFALMGVRDHALLTGDPAVMAVAERLAADLARALPRFDTGYWSLYDLAGDVASPFYHDLHVAQLEALALAFPAQATAFGAVRARFVAHRNSPPKRVWAILLKVRQKIGQADVGEMS